jgi:lactoylglutathione lyase
VQRLATVVDHVSDLDRAKSWQEQAFGPRPYFDEPFDVGFATAGYELGLHPEESQFSPGPGGVPSHGRTWFTCRP